MSKDKKRNKVCREFRELLTSPDLAKYLEPERKLDAVGVDGLETLKAAEDHIIADPYYILVNDPKAGHDIPPGINVTADDINNFEVPYAREDTPRRFRVYYDTPKLEAFRDLGVEIRIEFPKATEHGRAKTYKQVVKLGRAATAEDPTFHRIEIAGRLSKPVPSFEPSVLDGNKKLAAFLQDNIDVKTLLPLQLISTVRTRIWCRPGGDPNTIVEYAFDRGRGLTVANHNYHIRQIEPEVTRGDEKILASLGPRLKDQFGDRLVVNLCSKPSPGFDSLWEVLKHNERAQDYLRQHLKQEQFRVVSPQECPALHLHN